MTTQLFQKYSELSGPSAYEHEVIREFHKDAMQYTREYTFDRLGSHFYSIGNHTSEYTILVNAHFDEVGMLITGVDIDGLLMFECIGGIDPILLIGMKVRITKSDGTYQKGIIASQSVHFAKEKGQDISQLRIDIGAASKKEVEEMRVHFGDYAVPESAFERLSEHRYIGKAIDNRFGLVLALETLAHFSKKNLRCRLVIGADVQEEIGCLGARTTAYHINPTLAFTIDASPANDIFVREKNGQLGSGALIRLKDRHIITSPFLNKKLVTLAKENDILVQPYVSKGGTDAARIHDSKVGVPVAVIGLPARYIHTAHAVFDMRDYEACRALLWQSITYFDEHIEELGGDVWI